MAIRKNESAAPWYEQDDTKGELRRDKYAQPPAASESVRPVPEHQPALCERVWEQIQGEAAMQLAPGAFVDWVRPLKALLLEDETLLVQCPDARRLEIVTYRKPLFLRIMHSLGMEGLQLEFEIAPGRNNDRGH